MSNPFTAEELKQLLGEITMMLPGDDDSVDRLKATIAALKARIAELEERCSHTEVQLAGCLTAAEGWNGNPAKPGDYGWSPAYEKVLWLRRLAEKHIDIAKAIESEAE